jgi:hypothetical protein
VNAAWVEAWVATERLLGELDAAVRAAGARLGVVLAPAGLEFDPAMRWDDLYFPALRERTWDFAYPHRRLEAVLDDAGVPHRSLLPALRAHHAATGRSGYYRFDSHWDPEGHAVVADALAGFVEALIASTTAERSATGARR